MTTDLDLPEWLPRKTAALLLGGRRALERAERAGEVRREYPVGLKRARYRRAAVLAHRVVRVNLQAAS